MSDSPFSDSSLEHAVKNTLEVGVESEGGQKPSLSIEAGGSYDGEKVDVSWSVWAKTKVSKASTSVGAKFGFKW